MFIDDDRIKGMFFYPIDNEYIFLSWKALQFWHFDVVRHNIFIK